MVLVQCVRVKHGQRRSDVVPVVAGVVVEREGRGGAQAEESTEEGGGSVGQHDDRNGACASCVLARFVFGCELKTLLDDWAPFRFNPISSFSSCETMLVNTISFKLASRGCSVNVFCQVLYQVLAVGPRC